MRAFAIGVTFCTLMSLSADYAYSKGGRGRGTVGRSGPSIPRFSPRGADRVRSLGRRISRGTIGETERLRGPDRWVGSEGARARQQANELRKLDHRLQTSDRLRENAERNGNNNLFDTANRQEAKAYQHYDDRMRRTADGQRATTFSEPQSATAEKRATLFEGVSEPRGGDVLRRRRGDEAQKLQQQLDVAQQLRDIAARNGNTNLLDTADRIEQMALSRFEQQIGNLVGSQSSAVDGTALVE